MMTLLIIFVSIWIGLYLARELTVPLERLVRATENVSEGNLDFEILNPGNDEIATLTSSFNKMTTELKRHRSEVEAKNRELAEKSTYVEAILDNVTAGVISVSDDGVITTVNPSAEKLLRAHENEIVNKKLEQVFDDIQMPLVDLFNQARKLTHTSGDRATRAHLQKQFSIGQEEDYKELIVTATPWFGGVVFVIDDVSYLSKVQREAAWREVARRIAHEIKNPLTPIKLSAQRLQKKLLQILALTRLFLENAPTQLLKTLATLS